MNSKGFNFKKYITKEEINNLDLGKYSGPIKLIETKKDLDNACKEIIKCPIIGIDTETKPSFKKGQINSVAILQLATDKIVYIIRLKFVEINQALASIFSNTNIVKVGIAVKDDLKDLKKLFFFEHQNVIDLNILASNLGFESIGAKKLSALVLGIRISKRQQISNWESKFLTNAQLDYAATDAWICREIYLRLTK